MAVPGETLKNDRAFDGRNGNEAAGRDNNAAPNAAAGRARLASVW
jgi:hypothetical protein